MPSPSSIIILTSILTALISLFLALRPLYTETETMTSLQQIRAQLPDIQRLGPGLVGVFVGATGGICEHTAREFARHAASPRIYIIGRNATAGTALVSEFQTLNSGASVQFIQSDVSLLRNVDAVCAEISAKESKINLLMLSAGIMTLSRDETTEGIDRKLALHYYSRVRFTQNLLPLLRAATDSPLARIVSVLGGGYEWAASRIDPNNLDLKTGYGVSAAAGYATTMQTLAWWHLAADPANKGISFLHLQPGGVNTGLAKKSFGPVVGGILNGLFTLIPSKYASTPEVAGERTAFVAALAKVGDGARLVARDGAETGDAKVLKGLKEAGLEEKVWAHTEEVFKGIE
ncbi:short-chain dehydrogenases/reductase [Trichodelitschia bisporula]|uniref:Short-chain dehydrogenases/reductase n=1 Tax=Trichodelitschia bisporula TaxID=703511 RepID=A0A6G1HJ76_9PEZI|nr:short-chain dehydrogenases/reductase [Trichodelitschia bisporula]